MFSLKFLSAAKPADQRERKKKIFYLVLFGGRHFPIPHLQFVGVHKKKIVFQ